MENKQSARQEGNEKINRIAELQNSINVCQINRDLNSWFSLLSALYKEVYPKMSEPERQKGQETISLISSKLSSFNQFQYYQTQNYRVEGCPNSSNVYSLLFDFDCWLRDIIEKHNLGISNKGEEMF